MTNVKQQQKGWQWNNLTTDVVCGPRDNQIRIFQP